PDGTVLLHLAPGDNDRGDSVVTLTVTDDGDGGGPKAKLASSRTFVISSDSPSEPPVLQTIGPKIAVVGQPLVFTVRASDRDQDALTFSVDPRPTGATLVPGVVYGT